MKKHGLSKHPLYLKWKRIKQRVLDPNVKDYRFYGAKGIKICDKWINDPENFIAWAINAGWKPGLEIDRINCDEDYEPSNCRFITKLENLQNQKPGAITKHKYIYPNGKHFQVKKKVDGKIRCFGTFKTIDLAKQFCVENNLY